MQFIKTSIGEHDYHKPACAEYCKIGGEFCPFMMEQRAVVGRIVRWTDIADEYNGALIEGRGVSDDIGYVADYSEKTYHAEPRGDSNSDENLRDEYYSSRYTCWGDGSGFEYDMMSRNVIGPGGPVESVYDITNYGIEHNVLQLSRWNAWIDKFQYDYRFGRVSDTNAECVLFPNVDNPWMFTEYVFKGIGGDTKKCAMSIPTEYVVEPPLYDPDTLMLVNGDQFVSDKSSDFDGKYADDDSLHDEEMGDLVKSYRKIVNWSELTHWTIDDMTGMYETEEDRNSRLDALNQYNEEQGVWDSGAILYRARIPVQSIKWGEHGNIPPHTLDMTAPKDWLDPTATVTRIKAVYDAVVGTAIYAEYDGVIEWGNVKDSEGHDVPGEQGRQAYIYAIQYNNTTHVYSLTGSPSAMTMPQEMVAGQMKVLKPASIMPSDSTGEVCHGGCGLLYGVRTSGNNGMFHCRMIDNGSMEQENMDLFFVDNCLNPGSYGGEGRICPHYIGTMRHPKIATYQDKRVNVDNLSASTDTIGGAMGMAAMGGVMGASVGMASIATNYDDVVGYYANLGKRGDVEITYVVRYEPVTGSGDRAQLNKKKYNEFGQGVQIVPGTGKYAIDSKENANPFSGGDTNAYDDINTLSFHRFFTSIMHCSSQKYCNIITGQTQKDGFNIVAGRAGGEGKCRYYKEKVNGNDGCPYNGAPKRAIEFAHCSSAISQIVNNYKMMYNSYASYAPFVLDPGELAVAGNSSSGYEAVTSDMYSIAVVNGVRWAVFPTFAVTLAGDGETMPFHIVMALPVEFAVPEDKKYSPQHGGAAFCDGDTPQGHFIFCEFSVSVTVQEMTCFNRVNGVVVHNGGTTQRNISIYNAVDGFFWFQPLDNDGNILSCNENAPSNLRQHVDGNGYWFCKARFDYLVPQSNCMMIDNEEKFIGGWHPEYKDYSKIGGEFMQDIVTEESREGQGKGDYVHNGDYTPVPLTTSKKGYWIDQSGEYILDERDIGADEPIADDGARDGTSGPGACISYKKSNTEIDGETGKKKQPKTINGAVFSNDAYCHIQTLKKEGRPKFSDPDSDEEYSAPPIVNNPYMLPTMRHAMHCPLCDYYIPWKYHDVGTCPWCGSTLEAIYGSDGISIVQREPEGDESQEEPELEEVLMKEGDTWSADASIIRKFFKIYAIGNADVWAPPGTAIKTDAYFWRHQAQITNATRRQILHRLGESNNSGDGGAYKFNEMSDTSEMTLGYPEGLGKFKEIPYGAEWDGSMEYMKYHASKIAWHTDQDASVDGMYNPFMPRHMIPEWYDKSDEGEEDEGVIAPYTAEPDDALKLVSYDQMRVFRNGIEPIYAYVLGGYSYSNDYPTMRASYSQREDVSQPIIWQGRKAVVSPYILAATDDGVDSYQTYFSGDWVYGNVREYFPSGYTWWMMHQVLGGRYTDHVGGDYHMDLGPDYDSNGNKINGRRMSGGSGGEYTTSTRTVAKCAIPIYGAVPLDKEIVAAYVIIRPSGLDPSKDPIGRSWTGGPVMYHHYHAKPKDHYNDGQERHLHGTAGYPPGQHFDDDGNFVNDNPGVIYYAGGDIEFQDDSAYRLWGADSHLIEDDRCLYYENRVKETMTSIPCLYDIEFHRNVGTQKVDVYKYDDESEWLGMGYDANSFGSVAGFEIYNLSNTDAKRAQKFQYIVVDDEGFVIQKYPESQVWKTDTTDQIQKTIERHMAVVELHASDGTIEHTASHVFRQADSDLYMNQMPRQSQEITGYFDMSWANTKGYVYNDYAVESRKGGGKWDAPVIFQDDSPATSAGTNNVNQKGEYSGGRDYGQVGQVARVLPVTDIIQHMWNNRIERGFYADAGCSLAELLKWRYYKPLNKGAMDDDVAIQNNCVFPAESVTEGCYLLTDTFTYPKLDGGVDDIPEIDPDGDKYELAEGAVTIAINFGTLPIVVTENNCEYSVTTSKGDNVGSISHATVVDGEDVNEKSYADATEILDEIKAMFEGASSVEVKSGTLIEVKSTASITIKRVANSCYELLGFGNINENVALVPEQSRIVNSTSFNIGHSPDDLVSGRGDWMFTAYDGRTQLFTVDLLRAPLCMWQRNWRYEEGSSDYSNVKCPNEGCRAHTLGCSVAANKSNKFFDSSSPSCPLCGADLSGQPGANVSAGDGIMTYGYDAPFSRNPLIDRIVIVPSQTVGTSYKVSARADGSNCWRTVLNVECRHTQESTGGANYNLVEKYYQTYPTNSSGNEIELGEGEYGATSISLGTLRARFIRVECIGTTSSESHSYRIERATGGSAYQVVAIGDFSNMKRCNFEGLTASISGNSGSFEIISGQILGASCNRLRLSLSNPVVNVGSNTVITFSIPETVGGIDEFRVYGLHYKEEASDDAENDEGSGGKYLTITPMEDEFQWRINTQTSAYSLPEPPCQIYEVSVGKNGASGITLTELSGDRMDFNVNTDIKWTIKQCETVVNEIDKMTGQAVQKTLHYQKITGGQYYYDVRNGKIYIPRYSAGTNPIHWGEYEADLRNNGVLESYIPDTMTIRYCGGNGKSITLKAKAEGHGPSYMLEKNAIQEIDKETLSALPSNGRSCKMLDIYGTPCEDKPMQWICYNNVAATLSIEQQSKSNSIQGTVAYSAGEFRKPSFTGKELGDSVDDDMVFVRLFGDHCEACRGQCETEITLTGAPNQILSGTLRFKALPETTRQVDVAGGTLYYKERTGGIGNGVLIVSCAPIESSGGRMTLCYSMPELLIYAKEARIVSDSPIA